MFQSQANSRDEQPFTPCVTICSSRASKQSRSRLLFDWAAGFQPKSNENSNDVLIITICLLIKAELPRLWMKYAKHGLELEDQDFDFLVQCPSQCNSTKPARSAHGFQRKYIIKYETEMNNVPVFVSRTCPTTDDLRPCTEMYSHVF